MVEAKADRLMVVPPAAGAPCWLAPCPLIGGLFYPAARPVSYYGRPLKGSVIVRNPGHGGIDSGSHYEGRILRRTSSCGRTGCAASCPRPAPRDVTRGRTRTPANTSPATLLRYQRDMHGAQGHQRVRCGPLYQPAFKLVQRPHGQGAIVLQPRQAG